RNSSAASDVYKRQILASVGMVFSLAAFYLYDRYAEGRITRRWDIVCGLVSVALGVYVHLVQAVVLGSFILGVITGLWSLMMVVAVVLFVDRQAMACVKSATRSVLADKS
ncbi:MAG: hypothetical protein QUS33_05995, partial [Dehalococcoidia bacterium]|nr:hypothetical protein [Dehalococcoidia bacterium]